MIILLKMQKGVQKAAIQVDDNLVGGSIGRFTGPNDFFRLGQFFECRKAEVLQKTQSVAFALALSLNFIKIFNFFKFYK